MTPRAVTGPRIAGPTVAWLVVVVGLILVGLLALTNTAIPDQLWVVVAAAVPAGASAKGGDLADIIAQLRDFAASTGPAHPVAATEPAPPTSSLSAAKGGAGDLPPFGA